MKKLPFFIVILVLHSSFMFSQVAININGDSPHGSAMLDVKATDKGMLIPRMTLSQRNSISIPATGLMIYQTDNTPGFYYNSGTEGSPVWTKVGTGINWSITGNSGTVAGTNFIGTTDNVPLTFKVNSQLAGKIDLTLFNTSFGISTLLSNGTGHHNTAIGRYVLSNNNDGSGNTAIGANALSDNNGGDENTANGFNALNQNNNGEWNTATGASALSSNIDANYNTGDGYYALAYNTYGCRNTAIGVRTLYNQSYSPGYNWNSDNVAVGYEALYTNDPTVNTNGILNTAIGSFALHNNTTGYENTAIGAFALFANTTGYFNTAQGDYSLRYNTTACRNTALGHGALFIQSFNPGNIYESDNVALGYWALYHNQPTATTNGIKNTSTGTFALYSNTTGSHNIAYGFQALYSNTTGNSNVAIGTQALMNNTTKSNLVAVGDSALFKNGLNATQSWHALDNTAIGSKAMFSNTAGYDNTAIGSHALYYNSTGSENTAFGSYALVNNTTAYGNTAIGHDALALQSYNPGYLWVSANVAVGNQALYLNQPTSASNGWRNTAIGSSTLTANLDGALNTAVGYESLHNNSSGNSNVAIGYQSLFLNEYQSNLVAVGDSALFHNGEDAIYPDQATCNTAVGSKTLFSNTTGYSNTANGYRALYHNIDGHDNAAYGDHALFNSLTGAYNTACGNSTLYSNDGGTSNTALGYAALSDNTNGRENVAVGYALVENTIGNYNVALGEYSLKYSISASRNTAIGFYALSNQYYDPGHSWFSDNVAVGAYALHLNAPTSTSNGISNTAVGESSLKNNSIGFQNTALGANSLLTNTSGSYNTSIGYNTGPNSIGYANTTCLGIDATATGSDMIRIGNTYVGSIGGYKDWTNISDGRFKENVSENIPGLSFINQLRPVTYQLNRDEINEFTGVYERREKIRQENPGAEFLTGDRYSPITTGFIAQEVEQAARNCDFEFSGVDTPNNENDLYGLRYAEFVVPLVKAVQEQQEMIEELKIQNEKLKIDNEEMMRRVEALESK